MSGFARALRAALRRTSPFAREIALVLVIKTVLLALLLRAFMPQPAPSRPLAQQLLGLAPSTEAAQ